MSLTRRDVLLGGVVAGMAATGGVAANAQEKAPTTIDRLNEEQLGNLLGAMGLKPEKNEKRYDFQFRHVYGGEEWNLTMSSVLSKNEESVWVMAWLDELPRSAAAVPRTALLRMLAENDRLGNGKFFTYIASNRRFVLQRVVDNREMTTAKFAGILKDLGESVVLSYPIWSVENWTSAPATVEADADDQQAAPKNVRSAAKTGATTRQ